MTEPNDLQAAKPESAREFAGHYPEDDGFKCSCGWSHTIRKSGVTHGPTEWQQHLTEAIVARDRALLAPFRELVEKWRREAIESREEAGRIRRTVHAVTEAEVNCNVRAELWDKLAEEFGSIIKKLEG